MNMNISARAKQQKGFTLIELIVVIVILGILAATAMPKFLNLSDEANQAAANGLGGAILSSAVIAKAGVSAGAVGAAYAVADACTGTYMDGDMGACSTALVGQVCTVTCGAKTKAVTLPVP